MKQMDHSLHCEAVMEPTHRSSKHHKKIRRMCIIQEIIKMDSPWQVDRWSHVKEQRTFLFTVVRWWRDTLRKDKVNSKRSFRTVRWLPVCITIYLLPYLCTHTPQDSKHALYICKSSVNTKPPLANTMDGPMVFTIESFTVVIYRKWKANNSRLFLLLISKWYRTLMLSMFDHIISIEQKLFTFWYSIYLYIIHIKSN